MIAEKLPNSRLGNFLFWLTFCVVGQPMCIMLYFHDTVAANASPLATSVADLACDATAALLPLAI